MVTPEHTAWAAKRPVGRTRLARLLRNKFVAGLIILVPIIITVRGLWWLFTYVDALAQPLAMTLIGRTVPGLGFVTTVAVVFMTGFLFSTGPLKRVVDALEDVVDGVPLVGTVYGTTKKVLAGFGNSQAGGAFQRFVLAQLPGRTTPSSQGRSRSHVATEASTGCAPSTSRRITSTSGTSSCSPPRT
jgi:uncharacterized membrane protein